MTTDPDRLFKDRAEGDARMKPDWSDIDVLVQEVGPRDGLQATSVIMPTEAKIAWIGALRDAGLRQIQVGSFVPPKLLPQLADTAQVVAASRDMGGFAVSALVPNLRGAVDAIAAGVDQVNLVISVSEAHNLNNVRQTHAESLDTFARIVAHRDATAGAGHVQVSGGLATAFGCTISGPVPPEDVFRLTEALLARGADRIGIADTVGHANPAQVRTILTEVLKICGDTLVGAHFHDTRGLGLANAFAAVEAGVRTLDGCLGGLGGCPYAPGATGNVVTEDMVFMLEAMGLRTGINLEKLMEARAIMVAHLGDEPVHGAFAKAGAPSWFVPATRP